ncbi:MAG: sialate O-acetylesterase [Planctomycetaceae bacterium]|nr:sialate O-acetylesterase [Planctomycetaceae bacterium]
MHVKKLLVLLSVLSLPTSVRADLKLPNIFGDHMVVQQKAPIKVWGLTGPGQKVTADLAGQSASATANAEGRFELHLPELSAGGPHTLTVKADETKTFSDVLVGEVWICSGQSNMQWSVNAANDPDLEKLAAKHPNLRMINFPQVGTQEPVWTHDRQWQVCTPDTVGNFSAVGYFFGRQLLDTLDVPIGMINNAWGGSACEAWINRDVLSADEAYKPLIERWQQMESSFETLSAKNDRSDDENKQLDNLKRLMGGNSRPGNIYNGVLKSHLGYTIKGAVWYQGESNASRAYQYRTLFPLMISNWRQEWGQGDFPFYWVQLADFKNEVSEPADSDWAELREAQTMTMSRLSNTGEAVIIDIGEGKDIHPKNKVDVGRRLARWALAKDYGTPIAYHSPQYREMKRDGNRIVLSFEHVDGGGWRPFDVREPVGFAIAGEDRRFVNAAAKILQDGRVEVSADGVTNPVAVRYAWADNPVCNMYDNAGLPLTPFRTDDWPGVTADRN